MKPSARREARPAPAADQVAARRAARARRRRANKQRSFPERSSDPTAAARQRLRRARQANGQIPVMVSIDEVGWVAALIEAGFLTDPDPDKQALGRALSIMLDRLLHADLATLSQCDVS